MSGCIDKEIGKLLHDYEMNWLTPENLERFELHLMDCRFCMQEVTRFGHAARLLSDDEAVKAAVRQSVSKKEGKVTFGQRLVSLLWPRTNLLLRPALVYMLVILLLPLAYNGLKDESSSKGGIVSIQTVELLAARRFLTHIQPQPNEDIMLRFAFGGAVRGKTYQVALTSGTGKNFYQNDSFIFDAVQVGQLRIPGDLLEAGDYMLIITDSTDLSVLGTDTLEFRVTGKD